MTGPGCHAWRGELAASALGADPEGPGSALGAHLDGCPACREELAELTDIAAALALADPARLQRPAADPRLGDRVAQAVAAERTAHRRRRRAVGAAWAAAAVVVVLAVGVALGALGDGDGQPGPGGVDPVSVALDGDAAGTAELAPRPWGTEVAFEVDGLDGGEVYWVWLTGEDGERVPAGTMAGTGAPARAVLAAAVPADTVRRVWVTDEADRVVLDGWVPGPMPDGPVPDGPVTDGWAPDGG